MATLGGGSVAYSASAVEYGLLTAITAALLVGTIQGSEGIVATQHNECNALNVNTSVVNKKSLNPMCNLCLGETDEGHKYATIDSTSLPENPDNIAFQSSICIGNIEDGVITPLDAELYTDWSYLCSSRGGEPLELSVGAVACLIKLQ